MNRELEYLSSGTGYLRVNLPFKRTKKERESVERIILMEDRLYPFFFFFEKGLFIEREKLGRSVVFISIRDPIEIYKKCK